MEGIADGGRFASRRVGARRRNGVWNFLRRTVHMGARAARSCRHDASAVFYDTARIGNDTGDRGAIRVGPFTHVRGELLVFGGHGRIRLGSYCYVGEQSRVWAVESIRIGDRVLISHCVTIMDNATHPMGVEDRHRQFKHIITTGHPAGLDLCEAPVVLEDDVLVGCMTVILRGVTVGRGAIVGAGSVVTKDVLPFTIVAGNPARAIRVLSPEERAAGSFGGASLDH